jgi:Transposase DDE domain
VREIRTLRSKWRGLETWLGRNSSTEAGAPVLDPTTEAAIAAWKAEPRTTPGGQPYYSALAIMTALSLRAVFRLALRQTGGLIESIIRLLGLDVAGSFDAEPASRDLAGNSAGAAATASTLTSTNRAWNFLAK